MKKEKISIIMLTHNAAGYVKKSIDSISKRTKGVDYELIVVDNRSALMTRILLKILKRQGKIDVIKWNSQNELFAKGNNTGSRLAAEDATHLLLLNSDVEVRKENWLQKLLELCPPGGICSYGLADDTPVRADGFCMLIDKELYQKYQLDENYEWFWSVTKLQAQALAQGERVIAVRKHDDMLYHYGGKSGREFRKAKGMDETRRVICSWFGDKTIEIVERIEGEG